MQESAGAISIHALVKRATTSNGLFAIGVPISIHALVKRATQKMGMAANLGNISIHALVKRATIPLHRPSWAYPYFNPRPREEGDQKMGMAANLGNISIHALVKRATECSDHKDPKECISIHALVKRATGEQGKGLSGGEFQSTPS